MNRLGIPLKETLGMVSMSFPYSLLRTSKFRHIENSGDPHFQTSAPFPRPQKRYPSEKQGYVAGDRSGSRGARHDPIFHICLSHSQVGVFFRGPPLPHFKKRRKNNSWWVSFWFSFKTNHGVLSKETHPNVCSRKLAKSRSQQCGQNRRRLAPLALSCAGAIAIHMMSCPMSSDPASRLPEGTSCFQLPNNSRNGLGLPTDILWEAARKHRTTFPGFRPHTYPPPKKKKKKKHAKQKQKKT